MNERFKNTMNGIQPDEDMIERIIRSEVGLFRRALALLCWGLVFLCFVLNIEGIELQLYSAWLGNILLVLGFWMLRSENSQMRRAYTGGLLLLFLRSAGYWLGAFPDNGRSLSYVLSLTVSALSFAVLLVMLYSLFSGLRELALRFENDSLARGLMHCFWLYISLFLLILLCLLLPFLVYPLIPYAVFVLIKLPYTVNKLGQYVPLGRRVTTVKAFNRWVWISLGVYIVLTLGGELGFLYMVNAPKPEARLYSNTRTAAAEETAGKLLEFGMPSYVLDDLPSEEIRLYEGIYHAETRQIKTANNGRDGGNLEAFCFNAVMPGGRVRALCYYRWVENPSHTYVDSLSFSASMKYLILSGRDGISALSLFDKEGKTYRQTLLNGNEFLFSSQLSSSIFPESFSASGLVAQMQFRLYPQYENQRGYLAVDYLPETPEEPMTFWLGATYVHQESLWNRPHFSALGATSPNGYSHIQNGGSQAKAFWSYCFDSNLSYEPEAWVGLWPELE